ncbi:EpsG family protein [Anaerofilum sp. BX8]|uniref:EpsG family protein n=1 Tax=Anaerofilum hominis TaxID=2763016 RepID=A0A923L1F4_9FIRM|nr:EpsG family protein [Anaerofilum hominis]MBC5581183.1 EpsG family protein [Anaerofilum hominis]
MYNLPTPLSNGKRVIRIKKMKSFSIRKSMILSLILLGTLIVITSQYCDMTDYECYYREYNSIMHTGKVGLTHIFEPGYVALSYIGASLGIPFEVFYAVYMSITLLLLFDFYRKQVKSPFFPLLLFIIFPYINYVQQIRSALGTAIVLQGLDGLIANRENAKRKYLILVCIATLLQISNVVLVGFILLDKISCKMLEKVVGLILIIGPIAYQPLTKLIVFILTEVPFLNRLLHNINSDLKVSKFSLVNIVLFFLLYLLLMVLRHTSSNLSIKTVNLYKLSLMSVSTIFFVVVTANAYRIAVMLLPIIYITLIKLSSKQHGLVRIAINTGVLLFGGVMLYVYWGPHNTEMHYILTQVMWKVHP